MKGRHSFFYILQFQLSKHLPKVVNCHHLLQNFSNESRHLDILRSKSLRCELSLRSFQMVDHHQMEVRCYVKMNELMSLQLFYGCVYVKGGKQKHKN